LRSNIRFHLGLIGSGSWATAIAKILTDNHFRIHWLMPKAADVAHFKKFRHPPRYLSSVRFDLKQIRFCATAAQVVEASEWIVVAVPSPYVESMLEGLAPDALEGKYIVSGIKGILPDCGMLLNQYLQERFSLPEERYFAITGPCHAEEVAAEKLSYITISGQDPKAVSSIARRFTTPYLKTIIHGELWGAQYAAVLKNVYAVGAGIAHGIGYGDNFLAVYVANAAAELASVCKALQGASRHPASGANAFSSAYLGDLLVTCYSQYSRNRLLGKMIGKGYTVDSALVEMNMIAEGYHAARSIHLINQRLKIPAPVAEAIYAILWEKQLPPEAFARLRKTFV
jgi:glycerol-3-phosphate dehydrogenase (NAD(P)+)